ncbi:hypothetical protein SEA_NORZ_84 [Mycobacterium phage Norz]|nr:hypothetical protein SEA_NORZ_84 [Mycobacterium phage Norz]
MNTVTYQPSEIRTGMILDHARGHLTVTDVIYRPGRGLELHTRRGDGYSGPVIWPCGPVDVVYAPSAPDESDSWALQSTSDYPHARIVGVQA